MKTLKEETAGMARRRAERIGRTAALLAVCSLLPSCRGPFLMKAFGVDRREVKDMWLPIKPFHMGGPPDTAPEEYKKGWNDGCKTGMSTMVMGSYKAFYTYTLDPQLYYAKEQKVRNMYYYAWKDAYTYCRQYSFKWIWDPLDTTHDSSGPLCLLCPNEESRGQ